MLLKRNQIKMMFFYSVLLFPSLALTVISSERGDIKYEPNWKSLDSRPLPTWYDEAKVGIFIHWGVFSVPSFGSEWFWSNWKGNSEDYVNFMKNNYPENFSYQEFAKDFTAEFFNATQWAEILASSGAKYVVLTSKHHEGFTLWPSKYTYSWNSNDIGPHRNIVGELSAAVRAEGLTFGTYYSLYEWFNPLYQSDKASNFTKKDFVYHKILPEIHELIENFKVSILWSDGDWEAPDSYWNSTELLAWLYNDSPVKDVVVVNDRWGMNIPCHHGDFYTCTDRFNPGTLQPHKWENAMTIDRKSWGFRRNARLADYFTINELLAELASTISCGGNFLMNIGPTSYGTIPPIFEERLQQMGQWLAINGEGIFGSKPWTSQNDTLTESVWYTSKSHTVYAIILDWKDNVVLGSVLDLFVNEKPTVEMLGNESQLLSWSVDENSPAVHIRLLNRNLATSQWAWVLKIVPSSNNVI